jgi:RNA polymerase sigma-70 factor (sigma-E family)
VTTTPKDPPPERFEDRFDDLARLAYRVAYRILGDREEARDITQEALARAYSRWSRVEGHAAGWVVRVATNLALDRTRRSTRTLTAPPSRPPADPAAAAERADLVRVLAGLPRRQREVVVLRYLADLPEIEVAAALGLGTGTVKSHASRGLAALRIALGEPVPIVPGDRISVVPPGPSPRGAS